MRAQGYEKYLELLPRGPEADEAWWRGRVLSACGDGEGTPDEYRADIATYSAFLKRFPNSRFAPEARSTLAGTRKGLKQLLKSVSEHPGQ